MIVGQVEKVSAVHGEMGTLCEGALPTIRKAGSIGGGLAFLRLGDLECPDLRAPLGTSSAAPMTGAVATGPAVLAPSLRSWLPGEHSELSNQDARSGLTSCVSRTSDLFCNSR